MSPQIKIIYYIIIVWIKWFIPGTLPRGRGKVEKMATKREYLLSKLEKVKKIESNTCEAIVNDVITVIDLSRSPQDLDDLYALKVYKELENYNTDNHDKIEELWLKRYSELSEELKNKEAEEQKQKLKKPKKEKKKKVEVESKEEPEPTIFETAVKEAKKNSLAKRLSAFDKETKASIKFANIPTDTPKIRDWVKYMRSDIELGMRYSWKTMLEACCIKQAHSQRIRIASLDIRELVSVWAELPVKKEK